MLALLVWKGKTAIGRLGHHGWMTIRAMRVAPPPPERAEDVLKET